MARSIRNLSIGVNKLLIDDADRLVPVPMSPKTTLEERLKRAREEAGFASGAAAAKALGIKPASWNHYENGHTKGWLEDAVRIADRFGVRVEWLLAGRGHMKRASSDRSALPIVGYVAAQSEVTIEGGEAPEPIGEVDSIDAEEVEGLLVRGESAYPRYLDGDVVLVRRRPELPEDLLDQYAVVDVADGRSLIKIIRRGSKQTMFHLESFNAPLEMDVHIIRARAVVGSVHRPIRWRNRKAS